MQCILKMLSLEDSKKTSNENEKRVVTSQPKENDKSKQTNRARIVWYMGDSIVPLSKKN